MPTYRDISRVDLAAAGRRALAAGAAALAEAARRRGAGSPEAITHSLARDDRATVRISDPAHLRRERGDVGSAPAPFLAPDDADRHAVRAAIAESLRKDLL